MLVTRRLRRVLSLGVGMLDSMALGLLGSAWGASGALAA
jgi:hypothetical protein